MKTLRSHIGVLAVSLVTASSAFAAFKPAPPNYCGAQTTCTVQHIVTGPDDLENVLRSTFTGCAVIPRDAFINMSGREDIPIHTNVTLVGERGTFCSRPTVYTKTKDHQYKLFQVQGNNIAIRGIRFNGPEDGDRDINQPYVTNLEVTLDPAMRSGKNIIIEDNELVGWLDASVEIVSVNVARNNAEWNPQWVALTSADAPQVMVRHNYIHDNSRDGGGYGVAVSKGAYATIEANVFDYNRHAVASDGFAHTGYIAHFNYVLEGGYMQDSFYNQHFDAHGTALNDSGGVSGYGETAGEYYEIAYNAIRGAQPYLGGTKTRPSFMLRGRTVLGANFDFNIDVHDDLDSAVSLKMESGDTGYGEDESAFNFYSAGNSFQTDHAAELATGDFDGDGHTDVFVADGTAWWFSSAGVSEWIFLHISNKLTNELGFADIDNDGVTDILYRDTKGNVGVLKSGRADLVNFTTSPVAMADTRFGDFDGDGMTDIFISYNQQWKVWYGATHVWTNTNTSSIPVADFAFGEFDGVKGTDILSATSSMWAISSASTSPWTRVNKQLRKTLKGAIAADFDGDGRTDIAWDDTDYRWLVSYGASTDAKTLREADGQVRYPPLSTMQAGYFDADKTAEVVSFGGPYQTDQTLKNFFMIWRDESVTQYFVKQSLWEMR